MEQFLLNRMANSNRTSHERSYHPQRGKGGVRLKFLLSLVILLLSAYSVKATHYKGGGFSYNYLGDGRYEVFSKTYWDKSEVGTIVARYQGSPKLETTMKTVSQTLLADGNTVEHLQKQIVKWSVPGIYEVSWKSCCRSVGSNFNNDPVGLFAVINYSLSAPSSSPKFNGIPIIDAQQDGHGMNLNLNMQDPEGHEQVYTLEKPYGSPDSVYQKMLATGFQVSNTGVVTWENQQKGSWLVSVKLSEKINGVHTGAYIIQEFIINVAFCELPAPSYTIVSRPCVGGSNGKITLNAVSGKSPFKYSLDGGRTFQSTSEFAGLQAGSYEGIIIDDAGCISRHTHITLENAPTPAVTFTMPSEVCYSTQPITLNGGSPAGGVYQGKGVQNGLFYPDLAGVGSHTLTYTYTDGNGCSNSASVNVTVKERLIANAGADATVYYGYDPMSCTTLTGSATGGAASYTYKWSNGATTQTISVCPTVTTTYKLLVTDKLGCTATDEVTVNVQDVRADSTSGKKQTTILICRDGKTREVKQKNADKELKDGGTIGSCDAGTTTTSSTRTSNAILAVTPQISDKPQVLIYPNPVAKNGELKLKINSATHVKIEVIDLAGKAVKMLYEGSVGASQELSFEVGKHLKSKSVYIIRVITPADQQNYRLVVL